MFYSMENVTCKRDLQLRDETEIFEKRVSRPRRRDRDYIPDDVTEAGPENGESCNVIGQNCQSMVQ